MSVWNSSQGCVCLNGAEGLPLVRRQLGVPHVHDEDQPVAVGVLPDLVLEGVVKDQDFTLLPLPEAQEEETRS